MTRPLTYGAAAQEVVLLAHEFPQGISVRAVEQRLGHGNRYARQLLHCAEDAGELDYMPGSRPHRWILPKPNPVIKPTPTPRPATMEPDDEPPHRANESEMVDEARKLLDTAAARVLLGHKVTTAEARTVLLRLGLEALKQEVK